MKELLFAAGVTVAACLLWPAPAGSHDWYPWDCCSGMDCAPVVRTERLPGGFVSLTTKQGTVVVPPGFQRRPSQDEKEHACMRPDDHGGMRPLCYFVPAGS
jgi:hypothetical protein